MITLRRVASEDMPEEELVSVSLAKKVIGVRFCTHVMLCKDTKFDLTISKEDKLQLGLLA